MRSAALSLLLCLLLSPLLSPGSVAHAQRLLPRQRALEGLAGVVIRSGTPDLFHSGDLTAEVGLTRYFRVGNYLTLSGAYEATHYTYQGRRIPIEDLLLQASYHHPLAWTRGRELLLYGGIGLLGGYESVNRGETRLPNGATLQNGSRWVYGGSLMTTLETYVTDRLVLLLRGQGRFLLNQQTYLFRPTVEAGVRITL